MGRREYGLDTETVVRIAADIGDVVAMGVQVCLVIGGGNIFRGVSAAASGMDRAQADYMGMLATVMNALGMQNALEKQGVPTRVQSAIPMASVCEPYIRRRAERHMEKGRVVIFAAGTGNPFFTTDTAAALRAAEMNCDALLKGTQVDGVYSADPRRDPEAERYERLTYHDVLARDLAVMDAAAISLARENGLPIVVFNIHAPGAFAQVMRGEGRFTRIVEKSSEGGRGVPADLNKLRQDLTRRMDGALETLRREFAGLRTGRASPGLLEPVRVEAYGSEVPIAQVGTIGVPEPRMITVQVWDRTLVGAVERAIRDFGARAQSHVGRAARAGADPSAHGGAAQRAREGGRALRGGRARGGARGAARRDGADQGVREEARDRRG